MKHARAMMGFLVFLLLCACTAPPVADPEAWAPMAVPAPTAAPTAAPDLFTGEWAGNLYMPGGRFALKLTVQGTTGWLSLDFTGRDFSEKEFLPSFKPPRYQMGAPICVEPTLGGAVRVTVGEAAYYSLNSPLLPQGCALSLTHYPMDTEEQRFSEDGRQSPAPYGMSGDVLRGTTELQGVKCEISLARLAKEGETGRYPAWHRGFGAIAEGVRGAYRFGHTGADNDNDDHVFVYTDPAGRERISHFTGTIDGLHTEGGDTAFITTDLVNAPLLSLSQTPRWPTLCSFEPETGAFVDVSKAHKEFYSTFVLSGALWHAAELQLEKEESKDETGRLNADWELRAVSDVGYRAYEIVNGTRLAQLPELPKIEVNAPVLTIDLDGDGTMERLTGCFTDYFSAVPGVYTAFKLQINGKWSYTIHKGDRIEPVLTAVNIDKNEPGAQLAVACTAPDGTAYVELFDIAPSGSGFAPLCNDRLFGTLPINGEGLSVSIPGDGTVEGRVKSEHAPGGAQIIPYQWDGSYINRAHEAAPG